MSGTCEKQNKTQYNTTQGFVWLTFLWLTHKADDKVVRYPGRASDVEVKDCFEFPRDFWKTAVGLEKRP